MSESYDLIVIGGGPGGHAAALRASSLGAKVCIIEKNAWGGTCTHKGCIPTKALLSCSRRYRELKSFRRFGVEISNPAFGFSQIKNHQFRMSHLSALGVEQSLKKAGVELKKGEGILAGPGAVRWAAPGGGETVLSAPHVCIAWGSQPSVPPHIKINKRVLTSDDFLNLDHLPESIVIVGGNVIGIEFATLLAELGVRVFLIEILETILPFEDAEIARMIARELELIGVVIHTETTLKNAVEKEATIQVRAEKRSEVIQMEADYVLLCTGRRPLLFADQLEEAGIHYDQRGIQVDSRGRTNISGIYAIGDVTGGKMLAHRSMQQGKALASFLFGDGSISCREETMPSVIYCHPPIASVGLTERQAREAGRKVDIIRRDYGANMMSRMELTGPGFAKFLFCGEKFVGACIIGPEAGELVGSLSLAIQCGVNRKALTDWALPHPSLSEIFDFS